jgi:Tfp pilus assembly protein PilF
LGAKTKPTLAEAHYHAAKAYDALRMPEKSGEHFRQATDLDPQGIWGRLAQAASTPS